MVQAPVERWELGLCRPELVGHEVPGNVHDGAHMVSGNLDTLIDDQSLGLARSPARQDTFGICGVETAQESHSIFKV